MVVAGLLVSVVIGASVVEAPYYGIAPGDARPVQPRIDVEGAQVFSSEGEVLFVTVSVPRLTALGAVMGWLDPDVDVVEEELILGDQSPQEDRENNLRLMGYSKDFATYVALDKLGYDVEITDGGVAIDSLCMETAADGVTCAEEAPAAATLQVRDLITAIDDRPVNLPPDIGDALTGRQPGEQVTVEVQREGQAERIEVPVTLTSSDDGRTILGIIPNQLPPDTIKFEFPVTVLIDSGAVGGPSAGLAFTLALLDELTPGELTGAEGRRHRHDHAERHGRRDGWLAPEDRRGRAGGCRAVPRAAGRAGRGAVQGRGHEPEGGRCRDPRRRPRGTPGVRRQRPAQQPGTHRRLSVAATCRRRRHAAPYALGR